MFRGTIRSLAYYYGFGPADAEVSECRAGVEMRGATPGPSPRVIDRPGDGVTLGMPTTGENQSFLGCFIPGALSAIAADGGRSGRYEVRGVSRVGRAHSAAGKTREDDFAIGVHSDGSVVLAVADGLGDPRVDLSGLGAHLATQNVCRIVLEMLSAGRTIDLREIVRLVSRSMESDADQRLGLKIAPGRLATTLVVLCIRPDGSFLGFSAGDSSVLRLNEGRWESLLPPQPGLLNDAGGTLPGDDVTFQAYDGLLSSGAIMLATDGLSVPLQAEDVNAYFAGRWANPIGLDDFVHDLGFQRRGEFDDRTAVCVWIAE